MSEEQQRQEGKEKEEKQEEKEEKSWEEKWRRDPLNAAAWAIILIWGGLVLLANNFLPLDSLPFLDAWSIFFVGAGTILLLEIGFRLLVPAYRQPVAGTFILAIIFLAIGLGGLINWACIWALVLVGIGTYLLLSGLLRRRE